MTANPKIQAHHHERLAYVYIRQSSPQQVIEHRESQDLQYQLASQARDLGWPQAQIVIVDDDLGKSAISALDRSGFQGLVAAVGLGRVGLILVTDVSRLARNCADWKPFSRNTLKNGFNRDPPDPPSPSSAWANIAGAGTRTGGEGNPH